VKKHVLDNNDELKWDCNKKHTWEARRDKVEKLNDKKINEKKWVCADCGDEYAEDTVPCAKCGSNRVVLISVIEEMLGPNWRSSFK